VFPSSIAYNLSYGVFGNTVLSCKTGPRKKAGFVRNPYLINLLVVEFRSLVEVAKSYTRAALFSHIYRIFFRCANPKMGWVHTFSVIARMANKQAFRYLPVMDLPRDSVRAGCFLINHHFTIPIFIGITIPLPAGVGFINFIPKSFHRGSIS
jgi:hypothetical protein